MRYPLRSNESQLLITTDYLKHLPEGSDDRQNSESNYTFTDCLIRVFCWFKYISSVILSQCLIVVISYDCIYTGSLELISKVAAHVNESIRQVDNFKKLLEVQKKLVGDIGDSLISPSRVSNNGWLILFLDFCLCCVEIVTGGRTAEVFEKGNTATHVLFSKRQV